MQHERRVRRDYDRAAAAYAARWAEYTRRSLSLLRPLLASRPGRMLDAGCGTGALLEMMRGWGCAPETYLGVDVSHGMLRMLPRDGSSAGVQASAAALPLPDGAFDLVVSASSFHDWAAPAAALREVRRVLSPDGRLLLLDWSADYLTIRAMRAWLSITRRPVAQVLSAAEMSNTLAAAGFRVTNVRCHRISAVWGLRVAEASPA